jgi:hypothetical protein
MPQRIEVPVGLVTPEVESSAAAEDQPGRAGTSAQWLVLSCYLLGAVAVTIRLWTDPASRAQTGDLADIDQYTWFIRYSATAIAHGHLPALVTTAMNPPHGVNLLWNTSLLLPGMILTPVTLLAGPQVSLTVALTAGFAGSAASLFFVLRRWGASTSAAALGGAVYGFSPALLNSGIGHYDLQLAVLPPLIIDALLRIGTGRGRPVRTGIWLGVLAAAQLFVSEEMLIDTAVAAVVLAAVLVASRPRAALRQARAAVAGLATGAGVALLLSGYALWVQFHGSVLQVRGATTVIGYAGRLTHLYTLPYAFVTPSNALLFHTTGMAAEAAGYPQPSTEYLAYLGWPLIVVLIAAAIFFWRHLAVRVTVVACAVLELFSLGGQVVVFHGLHYPANWLPWYWLQGLPGFTSALPDRLCMMADGLAGAALAFSLDLARSPATSVMNWRNGGRIAAAVAVVAILPLTPLPYQPTPVATVPAGWQATLARLRLAPDARVLIVPVPWGGATFPMRWQADTGQPASMIGGDFIAPNQKGRRSRAGRSGQTATTKYLDALWEGSSSARAPSSQQVSADLALWRPAAVVAVTSPQSRLGRYLTGLFGRPTSEIGAVLGWRL